MARTFQNVSPFGDLNIFGKTVAFGETVVAHAEEDAESLASQAMHWLEVKVAKTAPAAKADDKADDKATGAEKPAK